MKHQILTIEGRNYKWSASQDSEHPDFVLETDLGQIWVQVEVSAKDKMHNDMFLRGRKEFPISDFTANRIICELISLGYILSYFETDVGLIFTDGGELIEN